MPDAPAASALTDRWTTLRPHPEQNRLWRSSARFRVVSAGRRSGKTELAKRDTVVRALGETEVDNARFILAAPTLAQAKEIFWRDVQSLVPDWAKVKISHTELSVELVNSSRIVVAGLDRPQRIEGSPIRDIKVDEYANCQADSWDAHIRPALSDPSCIGSAWLFGVPEGRNHFYRKAKRGQACEDGEWDHFTWHSADILPPGEIAAARAELDPLTYAQEYEGSFITFEGRAYYGFGAENVRRLRYDPELDLIFCFDFNVSPGVAAVVQEQVQGGELSTCVIGEVWIPMNSNTPAVCARLVKDWGEEGAGHRGRVKLYGDATGGARGTAKVAGTDWELIEGAMRRAFPGTVEVAGREFHRVSMSVPNRNPSERARVNALNSRIRAADGARRLLVDPTRAPHVVEDLEGVGLLPGGSGEIDKKADPMLTHLTDAIGYHVEREHPVRGGKRGGVIQLA
jgi:hypothetical protein